MAKNKAMNKRVVRMAVSLAKCQQSQQQMSTLRKVHNKFMLQKNKMCRKSLNKKL